MFARESVSIFPNFAVEELLPLEEHTLLSGRVCAAYVDCFKGYTQQIRKQSFTNTILMH